MYWIPISYTLSNSPNQLWHIQRGWSCLIRSILEGRDSDAYLPWPWQSIQQEGESTISMRFCSSFYLVRVRHIGHHHLYLPRTEYLCHEVIEPLFHIVIATNWGIIVKLILYSSILLLRYLLGCLVEVYCFDNVVSQKPNCPLFRLLHHLLVGDGAFLLYGLKSIDQPVLPVEYHRQYTNVAQHWYDYGTPHRASSGKILLIAAVLVIYSTIPEGNIRSCLLEGVVNLGIVLQVCTQMWVCDRYVHLGCHLVIEY